MPARAKARADGKRTRTLTTSHKRALAKGRTMIFSTHRLTSVVEMDEIIVIAGGQAIERGSHAKLLAANGMYRKLWDDQSHTPHAAPDHADDEDDED